MEPLSTVKTPRRKRNGMDRALTVKNTKKRTDQNVDGMIGKRINETGTI